MKFEKYVASKAFPGVDVSLRGSDGPIEGESCLCTHDEFEADLLQLVISVTSPKSRPTLLGRVFKWESNSLTILTLLLGHWEFPR